MSSDRIAGGVTAARGFRAASGTAGIKLVPAHTSRTRAAGKRAPADVALVVSDRPAVAAGVFTANQVQAAPVAWSRAVVCARRPVRAVLLNSGNANACTGAHGWAAVRRSATALAAALGCAPREVLVASTGVIGVPLPVERLVQVLGTMATRLAPGPRAAAAAARAIMTTDTRPKQHALRVRAGRHLYTVGGMAKGAGMIHPQMATLLGVITTDAPLTPAQAQRLLAGAVERSFNALTVDGDTSTNDTILLLANGAGGGRIAPASRAERAFGRALDEVTWALAQAVAADGEGATKLLLVRVSGASSPADARRVARTVASSLLVKAAVHGGDPNWGRVLAAAGRSGVPFDSGVLELRIGGHRVVRAGASYAEGEAGAARHLRGRRVEMELTIGRGRATATALGCDLTAGYVAINAHYRS
jgi:glutamate N-acetyltransferase/amino-acid N-acetyltransferase